MAIYTFSTKSRRPEDTRLVEDVKKICEQRQMNFSGVVVNQLREWMKENGPERSAKVQDSQPSAE